MLFRQTVLALLIVGAATAPTLELKADAGPSCSVSNLNGKLITTCDIRFVSTRSTPLQCSPVSANSKAITALTTNLNELSKRVDSIEESVKNMPRAPSGTRQCKSHRSGENFSGMYTVCTLQL
eukprot:g1021.t1